MLFGKKLTLFIFFFWLVGWLAACQWLMTPSETGEAVEDQPTPDLQSLPPELVVIQGQQIRQWAVEAEASSEYANPEWAAEQATGAPDTNRCGDYQTAWATASSDSEEWLVVRFPLALRVSAVNIIQSFNPNQVVMVELLDPLGEPIEIYKDDPAQIDQVCPYTLPILIDLTEDRFDTVRITVNQSILGLGWNQIDAVELVGEPE